MVKQFIVLNREGLIVEEFALPDGHGVFDLAYAKVERLAEELGQTLSLYEKVGQFSPAGHSPPPDQADE